MKHSARFLVSLFACLCLLLPLTALSGEVTITPLDESGYNTYWYYFPNPDMSLPLPLDSQLQVLLDDANQQALGIGISDFENTYFAFFAFRHEELKDSTFMDMGEEDIRGVLDMISSGGASLSYEAVDGLIPGQRLLRAKETSYGMYCEHLLALKGEWLLNMMAARLDGGGALSPEDTAAQEAMLLDVLSPMGVAKHYQSYTLPGSRITVAAPDSMFMNLFSESPDFIHLALCPKRPGTQVSAVQLFAVRDAAYENQTVLTLPGDVKNRALTLPTFNEAFDETTLTFIPDFANGIPALAYESDGSSTHLMALKDGWALYASVMPYADFLHPGFVDSLQQAALRQLLTGETPLPDYLPGVPVSQEGSILHFPLVTRTLTIHVPEGYGVDITNDNADGRSVYLYALDGSTRYYCVQSIANPMITADMTLTEAYSQAELQQMCDGIAQGVNDLGLTASSRIEEGPLGLPAVHTTTEELADEEYSWNMDSYTVSVSFISHEEPITPEESALLKELVTEE